MNKGRVIHIWAATSMLMFVLAGCGDVLPPTLAVEQGALGVHNAMPLFSWAPGTTRGVKSAEYSLDDGSTWVPVGPAVATFRPDEPLAAGSYTLRLRYETPGGWSAASSVDFTVQNVAPYEPNDTYYADYQWSLPLIDMPLAWGVLDALFPDRDSVVVAVVDTGYLDHPDVVGNINESDGYDFIASSLMANDGDGIDPDAHDAGDDSPAEPGISNSWHGTSVAGNIAAVTDNAVGVAGVAREKVRILPLRALGVGGGYTYDIAQAVRYAAGLPNDSLTLPTDRAKIINMSLGGGGVDPVLEAAMQDATAAGAIIVAASGNASSDPDWEPVGYPASSPWTIAAGAVGQASDVSYYSQMGAELDVVAPGGAIPFDSGVLLPSASAFQSYPPSTYNYVGIQGTSFACPHVAGAVAIMATLDPDLDLESARALLRASGSNLDDPLIPGLFEIGILNMASLLEIYYGGRIASDVERPIFQWVEDMGFTVAEMDALAAEGRTAQPAGSTRPQAPPASYRDPGTLIVRFREDASPVARGLTTVAGIRAVSGTGSPFTLLELDPDADLEATRERLLADPAVGEVFYNYRYYPL
jgi:subtilisin family serine protease